MSPRERGGTMNEAATPRVRRPSWRDPRLGVGVLLVAGAVALGSWTVSRADDTVTVYTTATVRAEEHTSELQSRGHIVCRLLLEKNKIVIILFYIFLFSLLSPC